MNKKKIMSSETSMTNLCKLDEQLSKFLLLAIIVVEVVQNGGSNSLMQKLQETRIRTVRQNVLRTTKIDKQMCNYKPEDKLQGSCPRQREDSLVPLQPQLPRSNVASVINKQMKGSANPVHHDIKLDKLISYFDMGQLKPSLSCNML